MIPYLKHLQAIGPSFVIVTKPLNNKVGNIFCKGLSWNQCIDFSRSMDKEIFENLLFSQNSINFLLSKLCREILLVLFRFISGIANYVFHCFELQRKPLVGKNFKKSLRHNIVLCKS